MDDFRYYLFARLSTVRDKAPDIFIPILDWIRYDILFNPYDDRHHY
jgi:hypothetical protein